MNKQTNAQIDVTNGLSAYLIDELDIEEIDLKPLARFDNDEQDFFSLSIDKAV
jgi:hypothetical protein